MIIYPIATSEKFILYDKFKAKMSFRIYFGIPLKLY